MFRTTRTFRMPAVPRPRAVPRGAVAALAVAASAAAVLLPAQSAGAATGSVHLYKIYYNSPGPDTRSHTSLDAEYVQVTNSTAQAVSLRGWTLSDASRHVYSFGTYTLGAHKTVTVHTGKGGNTAAHRYQGRSAYVWNNDKDTATLRRSGGGVVDTCAYNSTRVAYKMC